jgi:hypothetical protein
MTLKAPQGESLAGLFHFDRSMDAPSSNATNMVPIEFA